MQIPDEIRKCVVFLACKTNDGFRMLGTGFFVEISSFIYLVTAKHILAKVQEKQISIDDNLWVRINKKDGEIDNVPISFKHWMSHPDTYISVDIIACLNVFDPQVYDYLTIPFSMCATQDVINNEHISIGDEIFMTGLFINHYGKRKNIPIIRVGNICALDEEPIQASRFGGINAYLVETRSIGGLSGSPVFVHLSGARLSQDGSTTAFRAGHIFYLFGLMHGHWDLSDAMEDVIIEDIPNKRGVNMGIGIVVPFSKIAETLNQDFFSKQRQAIIEQHEKSLASVEDVAL